MIDDKIKDISDKITKKASGGGGDDDAAEEKDVASQPQESDAASELRQKLKETKGEVKLKKSQIPDLINYLDTDKDEQKVNASRALVEVAQHYPDELEKHIENILDLLDEQNSMVQKHACIALGVIGSEKALPNLNKTKETAEPEVANAAEKAMRYIKKQKKKLQEEEKAQEEPDAKPEETEEPEIKADEPEIEEEPRLEGVSELGASEEDTGIETEVEPVIEDETDPVLEEEKGEEVVAEGLDDPVGMSEEKPADEDQEAIEEEEIDAEGEEEPEPDPEEEITDTEEESEPEIETQKTPEPEMSSQTNFLSRANDGLSNARYELPTLVLLWGLLKSGDSTRESIENAAQEVIREYPEAIKSATPALIEILNEGDQDLAEFATIMVDEIVIEYPEELESQIPMLLDSLERGDERVKEQATNALTKLAQRSPDKVVEEFVERTNNS